jgi:nicotinamidase-related amidase
MNYTEPHLESSALITIDTQNDFTLQGAPAEIPGTRTVLPNMVRLLQWYRDRALPIVHIVRLYRPDGSNADLCRKGKIEEGARMVPPKSAGAELVDLLKPAASLRLDADLLLRGGVQQWSDHEAVIYKPRWGAFFQTPLENHLKQVGVDTLVFCGCNFPNCPRTSIYEASERDFRLLLIEDAVSGLYEKGAEEMRKIGVAVMTTESFLSLSYFRKIQD